MTCAVCHRPTCDHSDLAYAGLVSPAVPDGRPADDATTPRVGRISPLGTLPSHLPEPQPSNVCGSGLSLDRGFHAASSTSQVQQ
ncbi:hypothetical protein [Novosphingobium barchaimii]|uniref:hypothetical protein n=1 Tax=Novosphingobium barchaimii TaxID=1420591 RepID=UPI000AB6BE68|nr:hypothetical protein [Novosphingobium barchaimii]